MKYILLICFIPVLFFSCKKHNDNTTPPNNFAFAATYDSIIAVPQNASVAFSFKIRVINGDISTNHLNCKLTGLPANVTAAPDSLDVAQLLGGVFTINTQEIPVGFYPIQLSITSKLHGTETHTLALKITQPFDFAPLLAGHYDSSYDFCQPSDFYHYGSTVSTVADTPFVLKISNVKNLGTGFVVRALVSNVVTIPLQTIGTHTIWGRGTYSQDGRPGHGGDYVMSINDTLTTGIDTQVCTIHIEH